MAKKDKTMLVLILFVIILILEVTNSKVADLDKKAHFLSCFTANDFIIAIINKINSADYIF